MVFIWTYLIGNLEFLKVVRVISTGFGYNSNLTKSKSRTNGKNTGKPCMAFVDRMNRH